MDEIIDKGASKSQQSLQRKKRTVNYYFEYIILHFIDIL